ncbi:MAG: AraC family transcriptional regulator [Nevskia sp.]|jgi:AraC family transcriptional regulator, activator of mtrCDE|nr:AraC family transcriptional regulator [Nevskia sp.]MCK9386684.1 AraC family transcriptional regulator [Nevskia sp.]
MLDRSGESAFAAVLGAHQLRAFISDNPHYCGSWNEPEGAIDHGMFHLIDEGECWVGISGGEPYIPLGPGDLVLFPHGTEHQLCSVPDTPITGTRNLFTSVICGEFEFATGNRNPILDALPELIVVREKDSGMQFRLLAQLLAHEARQDHFGRQLVLDKLADALFVMALRYYIANSPERRGLIAALADPRLARVLEAIHADPGRAWTVAALAEIAHQSRTAFAQYFGEVLSVSPYQYLTEWRMAEAQRLLADPKSSAATIAEKLGYQTEAAFRRAFKKVHGYGPGQVRRAARLAQREVVAA